MSANESNLKLKVKVDTTELDKLPGKLKGINAAAEGKGSSGSGGEPAAAQNAKKVKASVEEMSASQQYAAEVTKLLSEEQSQLATNVDASEIAQKALGAALQSYVGISAAAIGATLAVASVTHYAIEAALKYNEELRLRGRELTLLGLSEREYQAIVMQGSNMEALRTTRLASLGQGFVLTAEQTRMTAATITMFSDVLGGAASAQTAMEQSLAGSTDAMRNFGFTAAEGATKEQAFRGFLQHIANLERTDHEARVRIRSEVNERSLSTDSERYKQLMIDGEYRQYSANQNRILQESIRAAQERHRVQADMQTQFLETQKEREVRMAMQAARESAMAAMGQTVRMQDISGVELGNRLTEAWTHVANVNATVARTDEQRTARANAQVAANQRVQAINEEINRRANTAEGIRERLRAQAIERGLAAGRTTHQLERLSISNGQVRAQLELRIAELRQRLIGLTGQDAAAVRTQIAGILSQLSSASTGGASRPLIALTEIRDMILQIRRAMSDSGQADFIRSIETGTLTVEQQALRLGDLQRARVDAEQRNREALLQANAFAEQLDNARNTRDRQRFAELTRKANEELTRTQETLRSAVSAHDSAAQAIGRANAEANTTATTAQRAADQTAYDNRARALQNQARSSQDALSLNKTYLDAYIADLSGNASDYQRTIAGLFSPETMLREIQAAATNATDTLASEQARLAQMQSAQAAAPELAAQQQRVVDATRNQAAATRDAAQAQADLNERMREASFGGQFARAMTNNARGLAAMGEYAGGLAAKGLSTFSDAIWTSLEAIKSGEDVGAALNKMLTATLQSIGQEATVRALMETAAGIAALATPATAPMAPGHFAAAGVYTAVAVAAGVGYMALPSPPSKTEKEKEKTSADRDLLNAQRREQNIIINGSALMTKEELSKAARRIADYGKDL